MANGDQKPTQTDNAPKREKYWPELEADEKFERMRIVIKRHADYIKRLEKNVRELTHKVQNHHHLPDGKAAMSIFRDHEGFYFSEDDAPKSDPDKVWF